MASIADIGGELNLVCRHGHTVGPFLVTWQDEAGAPVPLGAIGFTSAIYADKRQTTPLGSLNIVVINAGLGQFQVSLAAATSATLPRASSLFYIVSASNPSGKFPLLYGNLEMRSA